VTELVCTNCDTRQKVQAECENCSLRFGKVSRILFEMCYDFWMISLVMGEERKKYWNLDFLIFGNVQVYCVDFLLPSL